jgi:DNA-binding CsgD family transcriptional regulator
VAIATGLLELSLGNYKAVDAALEPITALFEHNETVEPAHLSCLPDKIEALIALGQLDRADALTDLLARSGAHFNRPVTLAASERCRAALHAARGDLHEAHELLISALAHLKQAPVPIEVARTQLLLGQVNRRRKQKAAAKTAVTEAVAICDHIGAQLFADLARAELKRISDRRDPDELTASEDRIARLAASGLTNREIARTAFMSQKTVEAHLSHIYRKLGIRSRAQLGIRLADDKPTQPPVA